MAHEILVGLAVKNTSLYQQYREAMAPILANYGGQFTYDFEVERVLKGNAELNRVFILRFEDESAKVAFFSDAQYQAVKKQFFEPAVGEAHILSAYNTSDL